ncbi:MAG: cell division protein FtsX [Dinoroseobacter sp.]|nr:cell division protein FtsX [Dinoroseobacter sp.]MDJ0993444.1 cell division protein FtsX [Dinoroseobacter sp.]
MSAPGIDLSTNDIVPPSGFTARLTLFTSAAMAFLAVFAVALSLASTQLATRWSDAMARTATIRLSAPAGQVEAQTRAVLAALETTPGVASARALSDTEQQELLAPWMGTNLPIDTLAIPRLIEVVETAQGFDSENLRLRLSAEAPGAVLDDHTRWRRPFIAAAEHLKFIGLVSVALIGGAMAAMITLAANSALAANAQVIRVLRLVGARDIVIARAFVRRFSARALVGALVGAGAGVVALLLLPSVSGAETIFDGLGFSGSSWFLVPMIPAGAILVAYLATRFAALRMLGRMA